VKALPRQLVEKTKVIRAERFIAKVLAAGSENLTIADRRVKFNFRDTAEMMRSE